MITYYYDSNTFKREIDLFHSIDASGKGMISKEYFGKYFQIEDFSEWDFFNECFIFNN